MNSELDKYNTLGVYCQTLQTSGPSVLIWLLLTMTHPCGSAHGSFRLLLMECNYFAASPIIGRILPGPWQVQDLIATLYLNFLLSPNKAFCTSTSKYANNISSVWGAKEFPQYPVQWSEWWPPKRYAHILIPRICECELIWKKTVFEDITTHN